MLRPNAALLIYLNIFESQPKISTVYPYKDTGSGIVTRKEIVWIHGLFSQIFWNMLKIAEWFLLRGQIFQNVLDELQTSDIDKGN